jgi:hypothetical protein
MPSNRVLAGGTAAGAVLGLAALARRYAAGVARADRSWPAEVESGLRDLGEVDEVPSCRWWNGSPGKAAT